MAREFINYPEGSNYAEGSCPYLSEKTTFTFAFWLKMNLEYSESGYTNVFDIRNSTKANLGFTFGIADSQFIFYARRNSVVAQVLDAYWLAQKEYWNHFVLTFSYSDLPRFYVNGTEYAPKQGEGVQQAGSGDIQTDLSYISIGQGQDDQTFSGAICEFGIWNRILSNIEIQRLSHRKNPVPPTFVKSDLIACWRMNTLEDAFEDLVNNQDLSLVGSSAVVDGPFSSSNWPEPKDKSFSLGLKDGYRRFTGQNPTIVEKKEIK